MSNYEFRPAFREDVGLFIGLAGGTQSGKTMSAMKMAQGIVGRQNKFAVVDTENRRALHYAPKRGSEPDFVTTFSFDSFTLGEPFSSTRYAEVVRTAYDKGYKAIVVDSATHEHDGPGGYLDLQSDILQERVDRYMKKYPNSKEYDVIDKLTPLSWKQPKQDRKQMMYTLLACSVSVPIIFCFRAEEKVFTSKDGKLVAQNPPVWTPICGKGMPFEMTVFFLLRSDRPGYPNVIKLEDQHKSLFPLDKPLGEESGRLIAEWAAGGQPKAATTQVAGNEGSVAPTDPPAPASSAAPAGQPVYITPDQELALIARCDENDIKAESLKKAAGVSALSLIEAKDYARASAWVDAAIARRRQPA